MDVDFKNLRKEVPVRRRRGPNVPKVKDKRPAAIQTTAEQIIRVASQHQERYTYQPMTDIKDKEELEEYLLLRRTNYERNVGKNQYSMTKWYQYANWEEHMKFYERARSIFERALEVDYKNPSTWLKYAEMEMRNKFVNHARNVFDRATSLLPRIDRLWYKYVYMEEMVGNPEGARGIFDRWLKWLPDINAFKAYVKMESRCGNRGKARGVLEKLIKLYPTAEGWGTYAKWESKNGSVESARSVFERAVTSIPLEDTNQKSLINNAKLYLEFARFEERNSEFERARVIYKFALDHVPEGGGKFYENLYKSYLDFERRHGSRKEIERVLVEKRRSDFEYRINEDPQNYDTWFDFLQLEEDVLEILLKKVDESENYFGMKKKMVNEEEEEEEEEGEGEDDENSVYSKFLPFQRNQIRVIEDLYERAVANLPPTEEKKYWKRYIYFWIKYAMFEETVVKNMEKARQIYKTALMTLPKKISFSKFIILYAKFEIRNRKIGEMRRIFGDSIGRNPNPKIFDEYIRIELLLSNIDRVRKLYQKYIEYDQQNTTTWISYIQLEKKLGEYARARGLYELAMRIGEQEPLDMPEKLWKVAIDFEMDVGQFEKARELYENLLQKTKHVKVWLSLADFEIQVRGKGKEKEKVGEGEDDLGKARSVFERADKYFKEEWFVDQQGEGEDDERTDYERKEQRYALLLRWIEFEKEFGKKEDQEIVEKKLPERIKRKRRIVGDDGQSVGGYEEYFDYVYSDEQGEGEEFEKSKLLEIAQMWKNNKMDLSVDDLDLDDLEDEEEEEEEEEKEEEGKKSPKRMIDE